jgi:hypothetical protein
MKDTKMENNLTPSDLDRRSVIAQKIVSFYKKYPFVPPCEVRTSTIHGRGLFATTDLPPNALLALYPPDAVLIQDGQDKFAILLDPTSTTVPPEEIRRAYGATVDKNIVVVGYPDVDHGPMFQAHIANDGAKGSLSLLDKPEDIARERMIYTAVSTRKQNATLVRHKSVPEWICLRTTRPVRAGEEILITYGHGYWLGNNLYRTTLLSSTALPAAGGDEQLLQVDAAADLDEPVSELSENFGTDE